MESPEAVVEQLMIVHSAAITHPACALPGTLRSHQILRFGGLTMDTLTGTTRWHSKTVALSAADRELLRVFLCRAGQIISRQRLAATVGVGVAALDSRVRTLRKALKNAGSTYLPYAVEGLGYVLWRG